MNDKPGQTADVAMKGGGYYSLATIGAKDVIDAATPLVLQAVDAMALDGKSSFTMADMGCADGGTSIDMVASVLRTLRSRHPEMPLAMVYSDQPRNDYNALFQIVHGLTEIKSGLPDIEGLHILASATTFYRQVLPRGSLNLGFSATAMHWLSSKPGNISNHVQAVGATGAELERFAERGRRDWETILLNRAAELVPGGRFVFANFCRDEEGRYLGKTVGISMFDTFNDLWRELLADGTIAEREYVAMTLPQYYRDVGEFAAPLQDPENPVHQAGLRLEQIETRVTRCPFAVDFERHRDAAKFAQAYIPTLRSWTEATFCGALDSARPREERQAIIDRYYDNYEAMVQEKPEGHGMDYVHAFLTVVKV